MALKLINSEMQSLQNWTIIMVKVKKGAFLIKIDVNISFPGIDKKKFISFYH